MDWLEYKQWVWSKYADSYATTIWYYCNKYYPLMANNKIRELELLPDTIKSNVLKSLIVLSKYLGIHEQFKNKLKSYGIKTVKHDAIKSFLRILKANDSDILTWYKDAIENVRDHERILLKFLAVTGMRTREAINSLNLIIKLHRQNRLSEYYDNLPKSTTKCLQHFKYPKMFLRNTKNVFISFIPEYLINEIANSEPLTYTSIVKRLNRKQMNVRFNELRDYYGTYLLNKNIKQVEIDLLQGRIPVKIFIRHYWSPKLSELRDRVLKAITELEQTL